MSGGRPRFYSRLRALPGRLGLRRWCEVGCHIYIAAAREQIRAPARRPRRLRLTAAGVEDAAALAALRGEGAERLRLRLAAGHVCMAAWEEEAGADASREDAAGAPAVRESESRRCRGFLWALPGPALLPSLFGCVWSIPAGASWVYDLHTAPEVVGLIAPLNAAMLRVLGARARLLLGQVELDNRASRTAHASLGYRECGVLWSWRLGGKWRHSLRPAGDEGRRGAGPSLGSGAVIGPEDFSVSPPAEMGAGAEAAAAGGGGCEAEP